MPLPQKPGFSSKPSNVKDIYVDDVEPLQQSPEQPRQQYTHEAPPIQNLTRPSSLKSPTAQNVSPNDSNISTDSHVDNNNALMEERTQSYVSPPATSIKQSNNSQGLGIGGFFDSEPNDILGDDNLGVQAEDDYLTPELSRSISALMELITSDESSEVVINGPRSVMYKKNGARYQASHIDLGDADTYHKIINEYILVHSDSSDRVSDDSYLVEGQINIQDRGPDEPPLLARVHIVAPPVTKYAKVTIAKKNRVSFTLDDLARRGAMTPAMSDFLKLCSRGRVTVVFSGLSGAGKTTTMEACAKFFDPNDRVIVVEDTPELRIPLADTVYLQTKDAKPNEDKSKEITMDFLVRATNRMRPDRILVGEVRGAEMSEFLVAANSGADGSMTTLHAGSPRRTLDKIISLAMKSSEAKNELSIRKDVANTVQLIVQMTLIDGRNIVSHIEEISDTVRENGTIGSSTIFEFDRNTGYHVARNRPSDSFLQFLEQRGVSVDMKMFSRA